MKEKILYIILAVILISIGAWMYFMQKSMNELKGAFLSASAGKQNELSKTLQGSGEMPATGNAVSADVQADISKQQKGMEENTRSILGKVLSVSGNVLNVEADLVDWKKTKELAVSARSNPSQDAQAPKLGPTYKKTYQVNVTEETKFLANKLADIKAGDTISVGAKELIYQTDKLTAAQIVSPFEMPKLPGQ